MEWVRGDTIGRGSFGTVNLAIPKSGNCRFPPLMAVKSASVSNSAWLANEEQVLRSLQDSSNIIRFFGSEISNGSYNLFLEYASGGSLADKVRNSGGRLPESDVRRYTSGLLKGLSFIHDNNFVHCDIKLANILVGSDWGNDVVKVADFGLAKRGNSSIHGFSVRGTPLCLSPESVNDGEYESPADIWAVGCAVVEMVTGKPAWRCLPGTDIKSLLFRIGVGQELPEIPTDMSEQGKDFLEKCFVKNPRKRWTAQMLLEHPFVENVPLNEKYLEVSASPRGPFDFPECQILPSSSFDFKEWSNVPSPESEFPDWSNVPSMVSEGGSPADPIRRLASNERPDWSLTDSWVTVR